VYLNLRKMRMPISAEHVSERFKVPLPQEGETPLDDFQAEPVGANTPLVHTMRPESKERREVRVMIGKKGENASQGKIDAADLVFDRLATDAMIMTDAQFMVRIRELVDDPAVTDLSDLRDRLIDLWEDMDPADLGALMTRAMAVAQMAGMAEVKDETED